MLITVKMPSIVGILKFINMINTTSESVNARKIINFQQFIFLCDVKISYSFELSMKKVL